MSSEESHALLKPCLVYSDPSFDSTPSSSSANSSVRVLEPNRVAKQNLALYTEPSAKRDDPKEQRPRFFIQHPILIKTDIPFVFKPKDMSYLKERYGFPQNAMLFALREGKRAYSVHEGWIFFYEIAFKLGLRLPFHSIINMPNEEGRYVFYARRQTRLLTDASTSGKKERYFFVIREGLFNPVDTLTLEFARLGLKKVSTRLERNNAIDLLQRAKGRSLLFEETLCTSGYWMTELQEEGPSKEPTEQTPEGIPLPISEVPYMHVLEGCLRLLYGEPTDPLWASYPAIDIGKMKSLLAKNGLQGRGKGIQALPPENKDKGKALQTLMKRVGLKDNASVRAGPSYGDRGI
ncbi:hypothetical protein FNV43_RR16832 [Rhamnella rubrinervis]|uniref:Uncharacterized protein n=1 Tax=Rhamnella rubrinervis TaxID=2594499 RepID=A0A8K0GZJ1_9ROSA|nr:hypothetical protein FNV43_RR16832 [Rhamnella rubrinervis]